MRPQMSSQMSSWGGIGGRATDSICLNTLLLNESGMPPVSFATAFSYTGDRGLRSLVRMPLKIDLADSISGGIFIRLGTMAASARAFGGVPLV
eukprot:CAMPEP_0168497736 /NCGR_PEP_ID=MMETSP0228-20121227/72914_1 /TAXON_ID=133427 /ORGANISM="Protoceratium reticulatum, Strain CCCM 535 (=CCMP 1889)" /LENGTH=92 /DNA_ID=CAMNT_0008514611 /DNA_START=8 /DNA_END=283 /DNA_ORIENTATION=+